MREMQTAGQDQNEKVTGKRHFRRHLPDGVPGQGPARKASEAGRLITNSRRWWGKAVSPGTFRTGIRGKAGEGGLGIANKFALLSASAYIRLRRIYCGASA